MIYRDKQDQFSQYDGYEKVTPPTPLFGEADTIQAYYHLTGKKDVVGAGVDFLQEGTKQYQYIVTSKTDANKQVEITYLQFPGEPTILPLIDNLVASTVAQ